MTRHACALTLAAVVLAPAGIHAQLDIREPTVLEEQAVEQFDRAVDDYVALHRLIEPRFPPVRTFDDPAQMYAERAALRSAIVEARSIARRGDVFTPAVSQVIRERLLRAIRWHRHDPADILADNRAERLPGTPMPRVNQPFPWGLGAAMWPTLLRVLPELPEELEYRFVDRDLVLIDMHANLVVDILIDALPPAGSEGEISRNQLPLPRHCEIPASVRTSSASSDAAHECSS